MHQTVSQEGAVISRVARTVLITLIDAYQRFLSPFLPPACRYFPRCSEYGRLAIGKYGVIRGAAMAILRILRCHPFARGGYDPIR